MRDALERRFDCDDLTERGSRSRIGAMDVETTGFADLDSAARRIGPERVMASGALPPRFPPVEIDARAYRDGGLVSTTPLWPEPDRPAGISQVDLLSAAGDRPRTLLDVQSLETDVRDSSRTRLTMDRDRQWHASRLAAERPAPTLPDALPDVLAGDPDMDLLCLTGPGHAITRVALPHRRRTFEDSTKDDAFSRLSM